MQNIESAFSTFDTIFKLNYISKFNELFSERDNPSIKLIYSQLESQFSFIAKLLSREYARPNNFNLFTQKLEQEISANRITQTAILNDNILKGIYSGYDQSTKKLTPAFRNLSGNWEPIAAVPSGFGT